MRAFVLAALLALAPPALADNFIAVTDPNSFNRIDLFMSTPGPTFGAALPLFSSPTQTWGVTLNTGNSISLQSSGLGLSQALIWYQQIVNPTANYLVNYQVGVFDGSNFTVNLAGSTTLANGGLGVIAATPEPSSLLLCGLAMGAAAVRRWRRGSATPVAVES